MAVRVPAELMETDPAVLAEAAGLSHVVEGESGVGRTGIDGGFRYHDAGGAQVDAVTAERIDALAIPPAWTDVWISPVADGHLQATGYDDAGRKQYRYHADFRAFAEQRKFDRLKYFARALVPIRKAVSAGLERPVGDRERAVAAAVRLIDEHLLRVGNPKSAEQGHFGATTLTVDHIDDRGHVQLDYTAKNGKERSITIVDDDLGDILVELAAEADNELFWFGDEEHGLRRATAQDINRFIVEQAGPAFSARDFRTWGGSRIALESRADGDGLIEAVDEAAEQLGNTRTVARNSYVHPTILSADQRRIDVAWSRSRSSKWFDRSESALSKLLAEPRP